MQVPWVPLVLPVLRKLKPPPPAPRPSFRQGGGRGAKGRQKRLQPAVSAGLIAGNRQSEPEQREAISTSSGIRCFDMLVMDFSAQYKDTFNPQPTIKLDFIKN